METDQAGNTITEPMSDIWAPTMILRWSEVTENTSWGGTVVVKHECFEDNFPVFRNSVLQQKWVNQAGEIKWVDVLLEV